MSYTYFLQFSSLHCTLLSFDSRALIWRLLPLIHFRASFRSPRVVVVVSGLKIREKVSGRERGPFSLHNTIMIARRPRFATKKNPNLSLSTVKTNLILLCSAGRQLKAAELFLCKILAVKTRLKLSSSETRDILLHKQISAMIQVSLPFCSCFGLRRSRVMLNGDILSWARLDSAESKKGQRYMHTVAFGTKI